MIQWLFSLLPSITSIVTKWQEVRARMAEILHEKDLTELDAQMKVLLGEIQGESWLQRNWRPIAVLMLVSMVVYSVLHNAFLPGAYFWIQTIDIPVQVWDLIKYSLCGYMGLRTVEKILKR